MKLTAGMIVFNAESILPRNMFRLCVQAISEHVDKVVIVDGATKAEGTHYFDGNGNTFTKTGSSTDGTVEVGRMLARELPNVTFIETTRHWNGKTEMCNRWLQECENGYVWQIDSDEFYGDEMMANMREFLKAEKPDAVCFKANHFWGSFTDTVSVKTEHLWGNNMPWWRIFKKNDTSIWERHEPPTLITNGADCKEGKVVEIPERFFHYGYVTRKQAAFKEAFYGRQAYASVWDKWQKDNGCEIVCGCRTEKYRGKHPSIISENYGTK